VLRTSGGWTGIRHDFRFFFVRSFHFSARPEECIVLAASGQAIDAFLYVSFLKWLVVLAQRVDE
jgi:hypothetical protein